MEKIWTVKDGSYHCDDYRISKQMNWFVVYWRRRQFHMKLSLEEAKQAACEHAADPHHWTKLKT